MQRSRPTEERQEPVEARSGTVADSTVPGTGLLTFHRCINYGSYWQARCMVEGVRALGQEVEVLDHDSWRVNRAEWKCAVDPLLPTPSRTLDRLRYALKILRFSRARGTLPRSARFPLETPERMKPYRRVLVGSDEVWNLSHPWYAGCRLFFGAGLRADSLVAYAASFGNHGAELGLPPWWAELLRRFDAVSVRDENSRRIVRSAIGYDPTVVLDPCLQFPIEVTGDWRGPHRPFVCVYGHSFSDGFAARVRAAAKARGLLLVSIGYRNDWADVQWLAAGPEDFAQCVARSEAVATNFFHGCVFALANWKPFVCEPTRYRANKILGLLELLRAERHLLEDAATPEAVESLLADPPGSEVAGRIERNRARSAAFLATALAA